MDYEQYEDFNDNDYINYKDDNEFSTDYYDDPSYQKTNKKSINDIFNDDEDDEEEGENSENNTLENTMDNDLAGYFSDARLFAPKKKMTDTMKKKPKRIFHKAGAQVTATINRQTVNAKVLFGPYESNKKQVYQLELDNGDLAEVDEKKIKPVE